MISSYDAELQEAWDDYYDHADALDEAHKRLSDIENAVNAKAIEITREKEKALENAYNDLKHSLTEKHKKMTTGYKARHYLAIGYDLFITFLMAIRSKAFRNEFVFFLEGMFLGIKGLFILLWNLGELVAGLGDAIPQKTAGIIVHWILQIVVSFGTIIGIGYLCFRVFRSLKELIKKKYKDEVTTSVALAILAIAVVFADVLTLIPVSLILLCIFVFITYMLIRGLYMWDNHEAKANLVISTTGIIIIIVLLWYMGQMIENIM